MARHYRGAVAILGRDLNTNAETLNEQLGPTNLARLITGITAWQQMIQEGYEAYVIPTGGGRARFAEAAKLGEFLLQAHVPERFIRLEDASDCTWENGMYSRPVAQELGVTTVIACTSVWHEPRATAKFKHCFGPDFEVRGARAYDPPTRAELATEVSALADMRQVIAQSTPGDIPSIQSALTSAYSVQAASMPLAA